MSRFCSNLLPPQVCVLNLETGSVVRQVAGHQGRVKRLATAGDTPGLVWSGAEDGLVRQWDLREKWSAENSNVLVNLTNQVLGNISLKCRFNLFHCFHRYSLFNPTTCCLCSRNKISQLVPMGSGALAAGTRRFLPEI